VVPSQSTFAVTVAAAAIVEAKFEGAVESVPSGKDFMVQAD
jgi:hypothetical protein